jgi:hypothetical protein
MYTKYRKVIAHEEAEQYYVYIIDFSVMLLIYLMIFSIFKKNFASTTQNMVCNTHLKEGNEGFLIRHLFIFVSHEM